MLEYNTRLSKLVLPEYGRNIQKMVDHCLTIEDRDERTRCAYAIIASMGNLFPALRNGSPDMRRKLWDHLVIMSDFKLDVDYPCEVIRPDELETTPTAIGYHSAPMHYRHYGKNVELLIEKAVAMPEGEERDRLVDLIANQMKKLLLVVNPDGVDDARVFKDLAMMSHGMIRLSTETHKLHQFQVIAPPAPGKKKKKK